MNSFVILFALVAVAAASNYNLHGYGNQAYGHGAGYGYGAVYGHGAGYGHARGGYVNYFNDHSGNTVPTMGEDQNNDGLADKFDSNRDGKKDTYNHYGHGYGYGAGYAGTGYNAGYGFARYPAH